MAVKWAAWCLRIAFLTIYRSSNDLLIYCRLGTCTLAEQLIALLQNLTLMVGTRAESEGADLVRGVGSRICWELGL
jgi:hypothetical protein